MTLIIFARPHLREGDLPPFVPSRESAERVVPDNRWNWHFGFHTELLRAFFEGH